MNGAEIKRTKTESGGDAPDITLLERVEVALAASGNAAAKKLAGLALVENAVAQNIRPSLTACFEKIHGRIPDAVTALHLVGHKQPMALVALHGEQALIVTHDIVIGAPLTPGLDALMDLQWGLNGLDCLKQPGQMGERQRRDLLAKLYGADPNSQDELWVKGLGSMSFLAEPEPMRKLFESCSLGVPAVGVIFYQLHSKESVSNYCPCMMLAVHMETGKYCALSRNGLMVAGGLNDPGPRTVKKHSQDVLMQAAMETYWSPAAYRGFKTFLAVLENKFSLLRVRPAPEADELAYVISEMKAAEKFFGLIPCWGRNVFGKLVRVNLLKDMLADASQSVRMVERMFFDPSKPPLLQGTNFNLFRGWATQPVEPADLQNPCPLIMELFRDVYCPQNDKHLEFLLDCLACKFQRPNKKLGIAIILRGGMGTGKSSLIAILRHICGSHVMETSSMDRLTGRFNSHLVDKLFLCLNEAFFAGNHADAAVVKSFITEDRTVLEQKFRDAQELKLLTDLIMTTNKKVSVLCAKKRLTRCSGWPRRRGRIAAISSSTRLSASPRNFTTICTPTWSASAPSFFGSCSIGASPRVLTPVASCKTCRPRPVPWISCFRANKAHFSAGGATAS